MPTAENILLDLQDGMRRGLVQAVAAFYRERLGLPENRAELEAADLCDAQVWDEERIAHILSLAAAAR